MITKRIEQNLWGAMKGLMDWMLSSGVRHKKQGYNLHVSFMLSILRWVGN